jgi:hypothetical protein
MLSVIFAECRVFDIVMLIVIMLNVVMLNLVAPYAYLKTTLINFKVTLLSIDTFSLQKYYIQCKTSCSNVLGGIWRHNNLHKYTQHNDI